MKRLLVLIAIIAMMFSANLRAEVSQDENWVWAGITWVYVGSGDPGDPPPPPPKG